jgi:hypothetical protein
MPPRRPPPRLAPALLAALLALTAPAARADDEAAPPSAPRLGVGWRGGNGLGLLGADVVLFATERLAFDVQLAYDREDLGPATATSHAIAPAVRLYLRPTGFTPYAAAGASWLRGSAGSLAWTRTGLFANVGAEWRWPSGLRVFLGAGGGYASAVSASDAWGTYRDDRYVGLNLELGVRYMLL